MRKLTKKADFSIYDYVFKKFDDFYDLNTFIKFPLFGVYSIAVVTSQIPDIIEFIRNEEKYIHLDITLFVEEAQIERLAIKLPDINISGSSGEYDTWLQMISDRELLFDDYMTYKLYSSIEHNTAAMLDALDLLKAEYKNGEKITRERLDRLFVINDIIYPRQVLIKFINMEKTRWKLLDMCMKQMDGGLIVGATVNNIRKMIEGKANYFNSGDSKEYMRRINTANLLIAYKVFCTERNNVDDPFILYKFYENGLSVGEIKGGSNVSI